MVQINSNTLRSVMKADVSSLGTLVPLIVGLDRLRLLLVICRTALFTEVTFYITGSSMFLICA
jgi:hypothetical protein